MQFKDQDLKFQFSYRDLLEWAMDLVKDPLLALHFHWDAEWLYKWNGNEFVQFIHEPWTVERFWRVQVRVYKAWHLQSHKFQSALPPDAKPLPFILDADKSKLSSFGTQKGYPVVARLANLDDFICNGVRTGSGCMVGWLPIVCPHQFQKDHLLLFPIDRRGSWRDS